MDRKEFLRNSLLATGAILLPSAVWALDKNFTANKNLLKFISKPNLKRFKVSKIGTKFFETDLVIVKNKTNLNLNRKYFVSENIKGIFTPTLLASSENLIFIPELYKDNLHNGYIVKVCEDGICEETKIFTHENQGLYAFWGKEYLGNPTLYHYNAETMHLMRMHKENEQWINHRVMPMYPNEIKELYKKQLQQLEKGQLAKQYGEDFEIEKDGFYQFLTLKNGWEQDQQTKEKELFEKENPSKIFTTNTDNITEDGDFEFSYTNPFVPIWCEGDDYSQVITKPTNFYKEVVGTKIEIENMPAYKTQDDLGDCKAFSIAAIIQQYVNTKWKSDISDPKNPPSDMAISYFGLMAYTNQIPNKENTFQPNQENGRGINDIIDDIGFKYHNDLILENCKPFENLTKEFSLNGKYGLIKRDEFLNYLKSIFNSLKNSDETKIKDCTNETVKLNSFVNLNFNQKNLKTALTKTDFDQFLYTLFFSDCKKELFPSGFQAMSFPLDSMDVTEYEFKQQIIKGLNKGKPVLIPSLCVSRDKSYDCESVHSLVISGYKKVQNSAEEKDVFKVHNSWGKEWQKKNNDGWVDADELCHNTVRTDSNKGYRIDSASVIWLD